MEFRIADTSLADDATLKDLRARLQAGRYTPERADFVLVSKNTLLWRPTC